MYFASLNCLFSFAGSLLKWLAYFLLFRSNKWLLKLNSFLIRKTTVSSTFFYHNEVSKVPFWIGHCHLSMQDGHLKLRSLRFCYAAMPRQWYDYYIPAKFDLRIVLPLKVVYRSDRELTWWNQFRLGYSKHKLYAQSSVRNRIWYCQ